MSTEGTPPIARPVPRDPSFSRHYADAGFAYLLGREVEIAFVQSGPALSEEEPDENAVSGILAETARTEVCRLRIGAPSALTMSIDIIRELVESKRLNTPALRRRIQRLLDEIPSDPETSVGGQDA